MPTKRRPRPRATLAERQPCTCTPQTATRRHGPCAACIAWDKKRVLLTDGSLVR